MAEVKLPAIARNLIQDKKLTDAEAQTVAQEALAAKNSFLTHLIKSKRVGSLDLALYLSRKNGYPYLDMDHLDPNMGLLSKSDPKMMLSCRALPLEKRGKILYMAISDPNDIDTLTDFRFVYGNSVFYPIVVEDHKLEAFILKYAQSRDVTMSSTLADTGNMVDLLSDMEDGDAAPEAEQASDSTDDTPVVRFLQKVLLDAINAGASDIHFEPYEKQYRIRLRQDGVLFEYAAPPMVIKDKLTSRIKVLSRLDISEKRVPQDGRMKLRLNANKAIDFRVSTLPTLFGEKVVMRILDPSSATLGIDKLGYDLDQKENLLNAVKRPYGMVLVTGPTGSGKTVSLYTCLNILNEPNVNISTAEDPAEINLPGVNQVNVNDKAGLTFSAALKSFLRQDPDVIMVGEIRDLETADIAMKAALTGHMVLSTLHTNDAPATITRLLDMGVNPFNITSAINLITAQRLTRRLCTVCKKVHVHEPQALVNAGFSKEEIASYGKEWHTYDAVGCDQCKEGYKGRVGIYQVMPITDEMRDCILRKGNSMEIAGIAKKNGIKDLRTSGLIKVKQGLTSLSEVLSATND